MKEKPESSDKNSWVSCLSLKNETSKTKSVIDIIFSVISLLVATFPQFVLMSKVWLQLQQHCNKTMSHPHRTFNATERNGAMGQNLGHLAFYRLHAVLFRFNRVLSFKLSDKVVYKSNFKWTAHHWNLSVLFVSIRFARFLFLVFDYLRYEVFYFSNNLLKVYINLIQLNIL